MKKQLYKLLSIGGLIWLTSHVAQAQTCASPATSNSPLCVGSTLNLSAPTGGTSYVWTGPNGFSSTQQNPVVSNVQVTASGIYTVKRTLFIVTCTATVSVVINAKPVVSALSNSPFCAGTTISLSATGGTAYTWAGPAAYSSILQNPTRANATTAMTGVYTVTAKNAANCTNTATVSVVVNAKPVVSVSGSSQVCAGSTIGLSATGGTAYTWAGPSGFSTTLQNPTRANATTTMSGTYTVTVRNTTSCTNTATVSVVVNATPVVSVSSPPVCAGSTIGLSATGGVTYSWAGPSGFSTMVQNPTLANATTTMSGTYTVTVRNAVNCTNTATINVVVKAAPVASVSSNSPVCAGASINLSALGGGTYSWAGPSSFASTGQNPTLANASMATAGIYTVSVTGTNACTATATISVEVVTCAGGRLATNEIVADFLDLKTYPNPATNELTVEIYNPEKLPVRLQLLDSQGQSKGEWQLPSDATNTKVIDIRHLPPMMYLISAETEKRKTVKKVLKLGNK